MEFRNDGLYTHDGSMVLLYIYIYGNIDPINIPPMLAYIPAPWILWDMFILFMGNSSPNVPNVFFFKAGDLL